MSRHHARGTKKRYSLRALEITAELGTDLMQIVCGRGYYNKPAEKAWKRSAESLDVILRRAQELGVRLTVEGLLPFKSNVVNSLSSASRMIEELNAPNFGCMIDTVPMSIAGNTIGQYFETFPGKITHIHLCDGRPHGHVALGDGELPIGAFLDELASNRYVPDTMSFEKVALLEPLSVGYQSWLACERFIQVMLLRIAGKSHCKWGRPCSFPEHKRISDQSCDLSDIRVRQKRC